MRTPHELVWHMTSVIGYARTFFTGGEWCPEMSETFDAEVRRFHELLADLSRHLGAGTPLQDATCERLLQGPLSDALTHAGQLAMLRRLYGSPVPPENFVFAEVRAENVGPSQPAPAAAPPEATASSAPAGIHAHSREPDPSRKPTPAPTAPRTPSAIVTASGPAFVDGGAYRSPSFPSRSPFFFAAFSSIAGPPGGAVILWRRRGGSHG